jgi:hypothetical protein
MGFSPGGNARSIEMGSIGRSARTGYAKTTTNYRMCQSATIELFIKYLYVQLRLSALNISYQSTYRATNKYSQVF